MQLLDTADTTTLSYCLNWRVLLCAIWILSIVALSSFLIWKYECLDKLKPDEGETQQDAAQLLCGLLFWLPFILVWIPSLHLWLLPVSQDNQGSSNVQHAEVDAEQGNFRPLIHEKLTLGIISYLFHVIFQMNAGAVMLTDSVFWLIIFPLLTIKDYKLNFVTMNMHTLNAVLPLGETVLNCLQFPWFRISYFLLWTCIFVIFQWIVHAYVSMWWPYPFLDLSSPHAPLWDLGMALMQIPCYGIFALVVKTKHYLLSRWFPRSYLCLR